MHCNPFCVCKAFMFATFFPILEKKGKKKSSCYWQGLNCVPWDNGASVLSPLHPETTCLASTHFGIIKWYVFCFFCIHRDTRPNRQPVTCEPQKSYQGGPSWNWKKAANMNALHAHKRLPCTIHFYWTSFCTTPRKLKNGNFEKPDSSNKEGQLL